MQEGLLSQIFSRSNIWLVEVVQRGTVSAVLYPERGVKRVTGSCIPSSLEKLID